MDPMSFEADRLQLVDELTCWIVELNLAGFVCDQRTREAATFAAVGAFRSRATLPEAMEPGKTIVSRHLRVTCS